MPAEVHAKLVLIVSHSGRNATLEAPSSRESLSLSRAVVPPRNPTRLHIRNSTPRLEASGHGNLYVTLLKVAQEDGLCVIYVSETNGRSVAGRRQVAAAGEHISPSRRIRCCSRVVLV
jgi:hypothetical protein